jgi:hypothetical protein
VDVSARDPLFDRYKAAWRTYQSVQSERLHDGLDEPIPYQRAALDPADAEMQSAAVELEIARDAFLTDFVPDIPRSCSRNTSQRIPG